MLGTVTKIAHISDIHFGASDPGVAALLVEQINATDIDAVILTGDLTQAGRKKEFHAAGEFVRRFAMPVLAVPGNHDAPVYNPALRMSDPWRRFRSYVQSDLCPVHEVNDVVILGLNSARRMRPSLNWSTGNLSSRQLAEASRALRRANGASLKLVAFHHPVLPGPGPAGEALIKRPELAMATLSEAGADALLTGHVHVANAQLRETTANPIIVAAAGTAASTRQRGETPSYNLITWTGEELHVGVQRYTDNDFILERKFRFTRVNGKWRDR